MKSAGRDAAFLNLQKYTDETEYLVAHPYRLTAGKRPFGLPSGYRGKEKISVPTGNLIYTYMLYTVAQVA
jgi:hypothetical protein